MNNKFLFILLKPDVFIRNLLSEVLNWFNDNNFSIVKYKCGKMTNEQYRLMYSSGFYWYIDEWNHNKKIFDFGPIMGLLVYDTNKNRNSIDFLRNKKGSPLPYQRKKGTVRKIFNSKSRIFNILHIPDNYNQSFLEASSWFGQVSLEDIFDKLENKKLLFIDMIKIKNEIKQHDYSCENQLEPEYTFVKVKLRLLHALTNDFTNSKFYVEIEKFYANWCKAIFKKPLTYCIEGNCLKQWQEAEIKQLEILTNNFLLSKQTYAINVISEILKKIYFEQSKQSFSDYFFEILDQNFVFISSLEKYLVESRLKYG